ncbi:MAG TPA: hypothetical protein VMU05_18370 [Dongiaceae bacterium]|nr:hypothetical protein [Dongiaceae bacterium]
MLSYAPSAISESSVPIAVILFEPQAICTGFCKAEFGARWKEDVLRLDPEADIGNLELFRRDVDVQLGRSESRAALLETIQDSFSNAIRISVSGDCMAEDPTEELRHLSSAYL